MAEYICAVCGYEGKPVRAPDDSVGEDKSFVIGFAEKLIFMTTFLPIKLGWLQKLMKRDKPKFCPNCGVPRMVKLNSDAGWMAKRKHDIRTGLLVVDEHGNVRHGESKQLLPPKDIAPPPDPGKLGDVDALLNAPQAMAEVKEVVEKPIEKPVTKKPVDPDQW